MPNKHNEPRRHHIPKMKFRVDNWRAYDAGLRRRGSLTLWITPDVIDGWRAARRKTRGGQPIYSDLAIEAGIMLRLAFHLALRQTIGLMASIFELMGVELRTPHPSTLSRRSGKLTRHPKAARLSDGPIHVLIDSTGLKIFGAGEWSQEKHGAKARRSWKKLHLAVDADTGEIVASTLTDKDVGDPSQVSALLDQVDGSIASVTADGAYDGMPIYRAIEAFGDNIRVVIPPHVTAVPSSQANDNPTQRDKHIALIADRGRLGWQKETDYGRRALVENSVGRYKTIIGPCLRARSRPQQEGEVAVAIATINRMTGTAYPQSVRRSARAA
jgi:transposase